MKTKLKKACTSVLLLSATFIVSGSFSASAEMAVDKGLNELTQRYEAAPPMVSFAGGSFRMGSETGDEDEVPVHLVSLAPFKIDAHPVTNIGYNTYLVQKDPQALAHQSGEHFDKPLQPVVKVSWYEADAYCKAQGKRLPTEAEYEYLLKQLSGAITGISDDKPLQVNRYRSLFNFYGVGDDFDYTSAVGSFTGSNLFGVSDLIGNVWEWAGDWYAPYSKEDAHNPIGPVSGKYKVLRGGSWVNPAHIGFESFRVRSKPSVKTEFYGFRCAASALVQ